MTRHNRTGHVPDPVPEFDEVRSFLCPEPGCELSFGTTRAAKLHWADIHSESTVLRQIPEEGRWIPGAEVEEMLVRWHGDDV